MSAAYAKSRIPDEMFSSAHEHMEKMVHELRSTKMLSAEHGEMGSRSFRSKGANWSGCSTRQTWIFARRASDPCPCPCAAVTAWNAPTGVRADVRSARSWDR